MIAIPNMEKPKGCWDCFNYDCDHWGEHGYDNSTDCPLIEIVPCGECKHRVIDQDIQSGHMCLKRRNNGGLYCEDDDFCSYGERRTDE